MFFFAATTPLPLNTTTKGSSAASDLDKRHVEIAGLKNPPNRKRLQMIERQSRKVLPQLGSIKSTWMGRRPTLPDSLPIIGKSAKNENVIYAFGHQHIGWTLGAVTGKIVDSISRDLTPNIDISAYSPSRF